MPASPEPSEVPAVVDYGLRPVVAVRLMGGLLVLVALLLIALTAVVVIADLPLAVLVVGALLGGLGLLGTLLILRRTPVVRFAPDGYRVRLVRGTGVPAAAWTDVAEATTASPGGVPVVVLRLLDSRTTTIPVAVLRVDRERFVRELQVHLQRGQGLRPLG